MDIQERRILLACFPKSGSTYLTKILASLPGFEEATLVPGHGRREQELDRGRLLQYSGSYVSQCHVRYSETTSNYIEEFSLYPVVLVRNIFDVVMSLLDHHRIETTIYPMAFVPEDIVEWEFERAADFVTKMVIPWYFNFLMSWKRCKDKAIVTYEDLHWNARRTTRKICNQLNIDVTDNEIAYVVLRASAMDTRRNQMVIGRGEQLSERCKERILEMASFYKNVDFGQIGI